jgi:GNAT superfamily N-acetyltransferase
MLSLEDLRPACIPLAVLEVQELDPRSPLVRRTTFGIGREHQWPSQSWDDQRWQTYLKRPHLRHWLALIHGAPAGLLSLDVPPGGEVEVDSFGVLPDHIGQGIGGHFLTIGVRLAWTVAPQVSRVWLHTFSCDHAHALPNYERRGFTRYQMEEKEPVSLPREHGDPALGPGRATPTSVTSHPARDRRPPTTAPIAPAPRTT